MVGCYIVGGKPWSDKCWIFEGIGISVLLIASTWLMKTLDVDRARLDVLCRRVGIAGFGVVGLVAYGEAGAGSDVDIRYDLERGC